MKYSRFEELPVWQAASKLSLLILELGERPAFRRRRSLRDQLERAALSVSNNIAEGFERRSAGEVRSMLCLMEQMPSFGDLKSQISDLKSLAENMSRQLGGWTQKLQDSPIPGPRYLNSKVRQANQDRQERETFLAELRAMPRKG